MFCSSLRALRRAWIWACWHVNTFLFLVTFCCSVCSVLSFPLWSFPSFSLFIFVLSFAFLYLLFCLPFPYKIYVKLFLFSVSFVTFISVLFFHFLFVPFLPSPSFKFVVPLPSFIHKEICSRCPLGRNLEHCAACLFCSKTECSRNALSIKKNVLEMFSRT